jgi:hypothetical protein
VNGGGEGQLLSILAFYPIDASLGIILVIVKTTQNSVSRLQSKHKD